MGDGCAMEGISYEAASLAGHWKLDKLTFIYDDNGSTIDGGTSLAFSEDVAARFRALGWHTITVDNVYDDLTAFRRAVMEEAVAETSKPTFIQVNCSNLLCLKRVNRQTALDRLINFGVHACLPAAYSFINLFDPSSMLVSDQEHSVATVFTLSNVVHHVFMNR